MEWQTRINKLYQKLRVTLGQCDLCGNSISDNTNSLDTIISPRLICCHCLADLPLFTHTATQGDLLNWPAITKALPKIHFDHLFCLSPYLPPFTHWLPQFKYQGRFELASLFADLLAHQWRAFHFPINATPVDLIISVPLHISKWQYRGYNQAHLIAKPLAIKLQLPYDETVLIRSKKSISQVGKTGAQRRKSLTNAFALAHKLSAQVKHVILVDDVLTTGSTASEISKLLKHAGVSKVTVLTVCLTLPAR
ncbi:DNA utilization protein GntX [Colwellia sp. KU-HH00111]|uniref:ComF family protein n=1 Tax=Colwellia sp. KU-HH00111 TaxID=3127652 RepID=UPI003107E0A9